MKVLLDENVPWGLRALLTGHDVFTVAFLGWSGTTNGQLLARARDEGFNALITMDRRIEDEAGVTGLPLGVVLIRAATNRMIHVAPLVPGILSALESLPERGVVIVQH